MKTAKVMAVAALGAVSVIAVPAIGEAQSLEMLDRLEPGSWALRERGANSSEERVCIGSGQDLVQLRHPGLACKQVVVLDRPNEVTVQYTCPGNGYGRTSIRRETNGLVQIDTQGIRNGLPFAFAAEGRRVGTCSR